MSKHLVLLLGSLVFFYSCKKDRAEAPVNGNDPAITAFLPTSAAMGTEVRIAGRFFSDVKTKNIVKFNGVAAEVTEANPNELRVIVPNGATTGKISITVDGRSGTSANDFTVTGAQLLITEVSPERSEGGNVAIKGTGFINSPAGIQVRFGNLEATVQAGSTETQLLVTLPATIAAGDHDVTVTANNQSTTKPKAFHLIGWMVKRIAGTGADGNTEGSGNTATFRSPAGMASDRNGNLYVIDGNRIRKISPDHTVSAFAGSVAAGSNDGNALTEAGFRSPSALTVDAVGNVYVADEGNHVIRKISTDGMVSTVAGQMLSSGNVDGIGVNAKFNHPKGIAINEEGTALYVSDWSNHLIRRIDLVTKEVTRFAGKSGSLTNTNGTGTNAGILFPGNLVLDSDGVLWVGQSNSGMIRKINTGTAEVTTFVQGLIDMPNHIVIDNDRNLFVLSTGVGQVSKYNANGQLSVQRVAGGQIVNDADGAATNVSFRNPSGFAAIKGPQNSIVFYIADTGNKKIKELRFD